MNEEEQRIEQVRLDSVEPDPEVVVLVEAYLDGTLTPDKKMNLERQLERDEVQNYFVQRLHFHAELLESQQPIRIEMSQKRDIVFEVKDGVPKVTKRESKIARVQNPRSGKFIELVANKPASRWLYSSLVALIMGVGLFGFIYWNSPNKIAAVASSTKLELRNFSFEANDLAEDEDGYTFSIFDWQDHFITQNVGLVRVQKYRMGDRAADGENAALMRKGSFLTQRLLLTDGVELKASKGLKIRLSGMAKLEDECKLAVLECALRVVRGVHPEMVQYQPCLVDVEIVHSEWAEFVVEFVVPQELTMQPSHGSKKNREKAGNWNISGRGLSLSLDHGGEGTFLLDKLNLSIVE